MEHPKLKPGAFLFDGTTGFIVQTLAYLRGDRRVLYITGPARNIAEACIDNTVLTTYNIHDFLTYVRTHRILYIDDQEKITTFLTVTRLIDVSKPSVHSFLRKDSFFENWNVSEEWMKKHDVDVKTWRHFADKWRASDRFSVNYKKYVKSVEASTVVDNMDAIVKSGLPRLFTVFHKP